MNLEQLVIAVRTRLQADTGIGGLFGSGSALVTGCYAVVAPSSRQFPFVSIDVAGVSPVDGFRLNLIEVRYRVHCFAVADNGYQPVSAIMDRIYGDGNVTPSYGLHRHTLTIASGGWTATASAFAGQQDDNDEDHYHVIYEFLTHLQKAAS